MMWRGPSIRFYQSQLTRHLQGKIRISPKTFQRSFVTVDPTKDEGTEVVSIKTSLLPLRCFNVVMVGQVIGASALTLNSLYSTQILGATLHPIEALGLFLTASMSSVGLYFAMWSKDLVTEFIVRTSDQKANLQKFGLFSPPSVEEIPLKNFKAVEEKQIYKRVVKYQTTDGKLFRLYLSPTTVLDEGILRRVLLNNKI